MAVAASSAPLVGGTVGAGGCANSASIGSAIGRRSSFPSCGSGEAGISRSKTSCSAIDWQCIEERHAIGNALGDDAVTRLADHRIGRRKQILVFQPAPDAAS
jgi:hypothetical protein